MQVKGLVKRCESASTGPPEGLGRSRKATAVCMRGRCTRTVTFELTQVEALQPVVLYVRYAYMSQAIKGVRGACGGMRGPLGGGAVTDRPR